MDAEAAAEDKTAGAQAVVDQIESVRAPVPSTSGSSSGTRVFLCPQFPGGFDICRRGD